MRFVPMHANNDSRQEKREKRKMIDYVKKLDENVKDLGEKFDEVLKLLQRFESRFSAGCGAECGLKIDEAKVGGTGAGTGLGADMESGVNYDAMWEMLKHVVAMPGRSEDATEKLIEDVDSETDDKLPDVPKEKLGRGDLFNNNATPVKSQGKGKGHDDVLIESNLSVQTPVTRTLEEQKALLINSVQSCVSPVVLEELSRALTAGGHQSQDSSKETTPTGKGKTDVPANGLGY